MSGTGNETALERYEGRTAAALTALAVVFIAVYAVPVLWPHGPSPLVQACRIANVVLWLAFAADLLVRVWLAPHRVRYVATHPLDVAAVVLPVLRPLRVLRVFTAGQALFARGARLSLFRAAQAVVVAVVVLAVISSLAVLDAERGAPRATITTFGDALWWSATTITTVGYGDEFPTTGTGRMVAVALMFLGISLLGVITATVAAWFIARTDEALEDETDAVDERLARMEAQLAELHDLLRDRRPVPSALEQ
jgi:voltage-gated potassium channel